MKPDLTNNPGEDGTITPTPAGTRVPRRAFLGMLGAGGAAGALASAVPAGIAPGLASLLLNRDRAAMGELTCNHFAPHLDSLFRLEADSARAVPARLVKARLLDRRNPGRAGVREPFALWFQLPASPGMGQRIYRLDHETLGRLDLFLVPMNDRTGGVLMEAIFG